jgi:hypothetical protein
MKKWSMEKLAFPTLMLKRDSFDVTLQSAGVDDLDLLKTDDGILLGSGHSSDALDMAWTGGDCLGPIGEPVSRFEDDPLLSCLISSLTEAFSENEIVVPRIGPSI